MHKNHLFTTGHKSPSDSSPVVHSRKFISGRIGDIKTVSENSENRSAFCAGAAKMNFPDKNVPKSTTIENSSSYGPQIENNLKNSELNMSDNYWYIDRTSARIKNTSGILGNNRIYSVSFNQEIGTSITLIRKKKRIGDEYVQTYKNKPQKNEIYLTDIVRDDVFAVIQNKSLLVNDNWKNVGKRPAYVTIENDKYDDIQQVHITGTKQFFSDKPATSEFLDDKVGLSGFLDDKDGPT